MMAIQVILMYYWIAKYLMQTDSIYTIYLIWGVLGFVGLSHNTKIQIKSHLLILTGVSFVFSGTVVLSNYYLFSTSQQILMMLLSGTLVSFHAFKFLYLKLMNAYWNESNLSGKIKPWIIFLLALVVIASIDFFYLFECDYPGNLSSDSIDQIGQIMRGQYSNHHPFWHTMIIKACISLGLQLFGEINAAVAVYSVFQIIFMSACFAYAIVTVFQQKISLKIILLGVMWYAFMPYHIVYSTTMWKDIIFAGAVLLFTTSLYRIWYEVGKCKILNWSNLFLGGLLFALLRSNGRIAVILTLVGMVIIFRAKYKIIYCIMISVILIAYILNGPILTKLDVTKPSIQESLSIPLQQIARVVVDEGELTEEQCMRIDNILDIEKIKEVYHPSVSDPIKALLDRDSFSEDVVANMQLWLELGIQHPGSYIKAWVDQTKGYWNGGYIYTVYYHWIYENDFGIVRSVKNDYAMNIMVGIADIVAANPFYGILRGIGINAWAIFGLALLNYFKGSKRKAFLSFPVMGIVATLLIATPLFSEFRYAYSIFTCIPFLTLITFTKE